MLTASTLIRMYGGLPEERLGISVCRSKTSGGEHPDRLKRTLKNELEHEVAQRLTNSGQQGDCLNTPRAVIYGLCLMSALHTCCCFFPLMEHTVP